MTSIAIIGAAHIHTPGFINALKKRRDVMVKSVWDHDSPRGQSCGDEIGARFFSHVQTILDDPEIKGVIVLAETNLHEQLVHDIVSARKHLFVEKPLGVGARDAYTMADLIERAGVIFQTGYAARGSAAMQFIAEKIRSGAFGKITRARYSNCHHGALDGWFDKDWRWMADTKQAGVGAFGDMGTHGLDILIWLLGPVERVTATLSPGANRYPGCDELGEGTLVFKNGAIGTLAASWDDWSNPMPLMISGTDAYAAIIRDQLYFKQRGAKSDESVPAAQLPKALPHAFDLFLDAVTGKQVPLITPREAAYRCEIMEALYIAAQKRIWIDFQAA